MKLSRQLSGITGEYYVAAELSRRGYLAAITLRNSDRVDIIISSQSGEKTCAIQVKTTQSKTKWFFSKKVEEDLSVENKFYVFVNIPDELTVLPEYFIIKASDLAKHIYEGHRNWLKEPGKNGKMRNDSPSRQLDLRHFPKDKIETWESFLELLEKS